MTILEYNGVEIINCTVRTWRQKAIYDPTGTDILYQRFRVRVNGYIYKHALPAAAIDTDNDGNPVLKPQIDLRGANRPDAPSIYEKARKQLMEQRRELKITFNGETVLQCKPHPVGKTTGNWDVDHGPKPQDFDIVKVVGKKSIRVEFEIECAILECDKPVGTAGVLSNRWSTEEDYDENFYATRTIRGRVKIASVHAGKMGPHSFRGWVFPPLGKGFKRMSMTFVASEDHLNLEYSFVDRQIDSAPPLPGTSWSGTHSMSAKDGILTIEDMSIRIHGPPGLADKKILFSIAIDVLDQKLRVIFAGAPKSYIPKSLVLIDHVETADVEARMQIERQSPTPFKDFWNLGTNRLGTWLFPVAQGQYDRLASAKPTAFGINTPGGILVSHLQTPCDDNHEMPQVGAKP